MNIFRETEDVHRAAAEEIVSSLEQALREQGRATLVLTGGNTPRPLYHLLAREPYRGRIRWDSIDYLWGDERCVPPHHPESNYGLARKLLLSPLRIPESRIHRIPAELDDHDRAAELYEGEIRLIAGQAVPSFTVVLLGMGDDGHTASLFPGTVWDESRWVVSVRVPRLNATRISMTPRILNEAAKILFLVTGSSKAPALRAVQEDPKCSHPAKRIVPRQGALLWLVDAPAAALLQHEHGHRVGGPAVEGFGD